jgi:hypothetical protein
MSNNTSSWSTLLAVVYGANWLTSIACGVAILVVILTVVRRHRPDAFQPLLLWAGVSLGLGVLGALASTLATRLATTQGVESVLKVQAANGLVGIATHVLLVLLLIRGLVAIAQPPKVQAVEGTPPYR